MKLLNNSYAGSLESSDVMIQIEPSENKGIEIVLKSTVEEQFGDAIKETVLAVLNKLEVKDARVIVNDKGALDFVIKSRVEAAVCRAAGIRKFSWEA